MHTDIIANVFAHTGPFATALVDVSQDTEDGAHQHHLRVGEATDRLTAAGAPQEVVEPIREHLERPPHAAAPVGHIVVATEGRVVFDSVVPARVDHTIASWQPLPDLTDWIRLRDSMVLFAHVLADREGSDIEVYRALSAAPSETMQVQGESLHITKVAGGGWSQSRYQRHAEEMWHHNAKATAEQIEHLVAEGLPLIVLGGDERARGEIRALLGKHAQDAVSEIESGGRAAGESPGAREQEVAELIRARVLRQRVDYAHELKQRRGQGSGARVGYDDVLWAFVQGQVATLLLDPESCRAHSVQPANYRGLGMDVPAGASITADVALVAAAAGSGADMAVLPATATGEHPAAALLRWDESSAAR